MKTIILNASPRKNWNTAQLLKSAEEGAKSVGGETEYYDLYDLDFKGCRSCLACKRKGIDEPCKCYWKDEFSPIIESIYSADKLVIGSPIYFGEPTGVFREAFERIFFPALSYNDYSSTFSGKVDVDVILTMNVPAEEGYNKLYKDKLDAEFRTMHLLNGKVNIHPFCNTKQVNDYSKFDMAGFDGEGKCKNHEEHFSQELEKAFKIGAGGK